MTLKIALLTLSAGLLIAGTGIGLTVAKADGYDVSLSALKTAVFGKEEAHSSYTDGPASEYHEPAALRTVHARYTRQLNAHAPAMDLCVTAGLVAEVALQSEDSSYESWLATRKNICQKAGL